MRADLSLPHAKSGAAATVRNSGDFKNLSETFGGRVPQTEEAGDKRLSEEKEKDVPPSSTGEPSKPRPILNIDQIKFGALEHSKASEETEPVDDNNPWGLLEEENEASEEEVIRYTDNCIRLLQDDKREHLTLREMLEELEVEGFAKPSDEAQSEKKQVRPENRNARRDRLRREKRELSKKQGVAKSLDIDCPHEVGKYIIQSKKLVRAFENFIRRFQEMQSWFEALVDDPQTPEFLLALSKTLFQLEEKKKEYETSIIRLTGSMREEILIEGNRRNDEQINWFHYMRKAWLSLAIGALDKLLPERKKKVEILLGDERKRISRLPAKSELKPERVRIAIEDLLERRKKVLDRLEERIKDEKKNKEFYVLLPREMERMDLQRQIDEELKHLEDFKNTLIEIRIRGRSNIKIEESRAVYTKLKDRVDLVEIYLDYTYVDSEIRVDRRRRFEAQFSSIKKKDK